MRFLPFIHKMCMVSMIVALAFLHGRFNLPHSGIWLGVAASAAIKSVEATDIPLCKVNLASLSKTSGAPGDVFEMYGEWEDTQGAKTAAINMGGGNTLEVLSWTSKTLSVRIPKKLSPGVYKVGVYCNNPPHWQGSGFKDFMVTVPAFEDVQIDRGSLPATESSAPLIAASGSVALQPDNSSPIPPEANAPSPQQKPDHNEIANPQSQSQTANSIGGIVDAVIVTLAGMLAGLGLRVELMVVAGVAAFLLLLKLFKPKVNDNLQFDKTPYVKKPPPRFDMFAAGAKKFEPFTGVYDGVAYTAEELGDIDLGSGPEPTVTVHIDAKSGSIKRPMEINAREIRPVIAHDSRAADINLLLDCGATYIDIGYNTDWVAVELPLSRATIDRNLVEHVVGCLIRIKDTS